MNRQRGSLGNLSSRVMPTNVDLPFAVSGQGVFIRDDNGRVYLDGSSGALAVSLGHGRKDLANAISSQASSLAFIHRTQFRSSVTEDLARLVTEAAPLVDARVMFVSSGSDANELALSMAIRFWQATGQLSRSTVLARERSYHGATVGALSMTGLEERRQAMKALTFDVTWIPSPSPERSVKRDEQLLDDLDDALQKVPPNSPAAIMLEPIAGTSGGAIVPPPSYIEKISAYSQHTGALLIADEVMSGSSRTGEPFASELVGLRPDLLTFGKGISGGYGALAGVLVRGALVDQVTEIGTVGLGHTYMNAPLPAAVGLAAARELFDPTFLASVRERGKQLRALLEDMAAHMPQQLLGVRGLGLMLAIDVASSSPGDSAGERSRFLATMREHGLILYPAAPHDPATQDVLTFMVSPPLVISESEVSELVRRLELGLNTFADDSIG